jgi:hypothetical protein
MSNSPKSLYQYLGKDDTYELLGDCIGAGTDRGHDTMVYRNIHTGQLHSRFPDDFADRLHRIGERVEYQNDFDTVLLREVLELLEHVTFHDGRYRQELVVNFQLTAQKLVVRLAERLGVKPYESIGSAS